MIKTGTTTVNGNMVAPLSLKRHVPLAADVVSPVDALAIPIRWNEDYWGLSVHSIASGLGTLASTEVTVRIYYKNL